MDFVTYFYTRRERLGVTQTALARKLGYSNGQFISNWERGRSLPPPRTIKKIAKLIDCDVSILAELYLRELVSKARSKIYGKRGAA